MRAAAIIWSSSFRGIPSELYPNPTVAHNTRRSQTSQRSDEPRKVDFDIHSHEDAQTAIFGVLLFFGSFGCATFLFFHPFFGEPRRRRSFFAFGLITHPR